MLDYDPAAHSLAVELVPDGEDLFEYHARIRDFPEDAGEVTGRALGIFHGETAPLLRDPAVVYVIPREPPWIFTLNPRTLSPLTSMDVPGNQLAAVLRAMPDLLALLVSLQNEWREDTLVHGDMKWENCVVFRRPDGRLQLRLVDWELVSVGDASWDAGSIFTSYLLYLLFAVQGDGRSSPDRMFGEARSMLQRARPGLAAFWREYARTRSLDQNLSNYYLVRTMRFCAARLVVAAFEHMFNFGQAAVHTLAMMQMARNIFLDPVSAANEMAGSEVPA